MRDKILSNYLIADVQLKPQHVPFRILQEWPHFVHKYSMGSEMEKSAGNIMQFLGILLY